MSTRRTSIRVGAATLGAATLVAGLAIASGPALAGVRDAGNSGADRTLVGQDDDNPANPAIQPSTVDPTRNQSLRNGDILRGGRGNDTLIGRTGPDLLNGEDGDDVLIGGTERGSDVAAFPNFDKAFGRRGDDIFVWTPGDGSDAFLGGEDPRFETVLQRRTIRAGGRRIPTLRTVRKRLPNDNDFLILGTAALSSNDNSLPALRRTRFGNVPSVNVSGKNLPATQGNPEIPTTRGFCEFVGAPGGSNFDYLVRFFVEPPTGAAPFQAVTIRTRNVENVLCRTRGSDTITHTFLGNRGNGPVRTRTTDFTPRPGTKLAAIVS